VAIPWTSPVPAAVKGIIRVPAHNTPIKASRREALLIAIAKGRPWIDDLAHGRAASLSAPAPDPGLPHSIGRLSISAPSHHSLSLAAFITYCRI
jgi:hypothetical protein